MPTGVPSEATSTPTARQGGELGGLGPPAEVLPGPCTPQAVLVSWPTRSRRAVGTGHVVVVHVEPSATSRGRVDYRPPQ